MKIVEIDLEYKTFEEAGLEPLNGFSVNDLTKNFKYPDKEQLFIGDVIVVGNKVHVGYLGDKNFKVIEHINSKITPREITKGDFRKRFLFEQRVAIENSVNPVVVTIRKDFEAEPIISLDDEQLISALNILKENGFIDDTDIERLRA